MEIIKSFKYLFEPDLQAEINQVAKSVTVKAGDKIIDYGQTINNIPLVSSGIIKVSRIEQEGREILLYYVNPNESCAMTFTCCMEKRPSQIQAVAEEDVEMLSIPIEYMDKWMMKYVTWKNFVMGTIHERFDELLKTIDMIAFQKLDERLKHYLTQKAKTTGSRLLNLSHEDIAKDLATSRVVISRLLKQLENMDLLLLYRNQIKLLSAFMENEN